MAECAVLKFNSKEQRIEAWADQFYYVIKRYGWISASRWLLADVPSQLIPQVQQLVQKRLSEEDNKNVK
jgi:hypothetical protein